MVLRGQVKNGVVVLEDPKALAEGTEVLVRPIKPRRTPAKGKKSPVTVKPGLLKLAGKAKDLPHDASRNVEHYLYGHPKR